jgi:hypothetical protein
MSQLNEWQNFYIIVGSSPGALIGLQFVVITLIDRASQPVAEAGPANGHLTCSIQMRGYR